MSASPSSTDASLQPDAQAARIYFLPNLMTAGNLFCGFVAIIRCIQARQFELKHEILAGLATTDPAAVAGLLDQASLFYKQAVWLLLGGVIFDSLDGRLARMGGKESLFGKEFDSLADVVSFGVAPALMVFFLILSPVTGPVFFQKIGWLVGFAYLLCGAIRLARFNVLTRPIQRSYAVSDRLSKDFLGLPIPAAAGTVASLVLVLLEHELPRPLAMAVLGFLLLVAALMVSVVRYPSFKQVDWSTKTRLSTFFGAILLAIAIINLQEIALVLIFLAYIGYGLWRHVRLELQRRAYRKLLRQARLQQLVGKASTTPQ